MVKKGKISSVNMEEIATSVIAEIYGDYDTYIDREDLKEMWENAVSIGDFKNQLREYLTLGKENYD